MRKTLIALATAAALLVPIAPASARVDDSPGGNTVGRWPTNPRPIVLEGSDKDVYVLPCVTTTWRAQHWNKPKTRPDSFCYKADRSTWIPKAWIKVDWIKVNGKVRPVYLAARG